jgi:hypothetical protein
LNIDDKLLERAIQLSSSREKTAVVHAGIEALIVSETDARSTRPHATEWTRECSARSSLHLADELLQLTVGQLEVIELFIEHPHVAFELRVQRSSGHDVGQPRDTW